MLTGWRGTLAPLYCQIRFRGKGASSFCKTSGSTFGIPSAEGPFREANDPSELRNLQL